MGKTEQYHTTSKHKACTYSMGCAVSSLRVTSDAHIRDPFHLRFFHHNSNSMEISFSSNSVTGDYIDTTFGTCHDSSAVVPCAKFCSDTFISIWMRGKWNFHHIWIVMEKLLVKWAPGFHVFTSTLFHKPLLGIPVIFTVYISTIDIKYIMHNGQCKNTIQHVIRNTF